MAQKITEKLKQEINDEIIEEHIRKVIERFLLTLTTIPSAQEWANFYYGKEEAPLIRLNNLRHYFYLMACRELLLGLPYAKALVKIFAIKSIICLGRKAENMAERLGLPYSYVRHPANGGGRLFLESS